MQYMLKTLIDFLYSVFVLNQNVIEMIFHTVSSL